MARPTSKWCNYKIKVTSYILAAKGTSWWSLKCQSENQLCKTFPLVWGTLKFNLSPKTEERSRSRKTNRTNQNKQTKSKQRALRWKDKFSPQRARTWSVPSHSPFLRYTCTVRSTERAASRSSTETGPKAEGPAASASSCDWKIPWPWSDWLLLWKVAHTFYTVDLAWLSRRAKTRLLYFYYNHTSILMENQNFK